MAAVVAAAAMTAGARAMAAAAARARAERRRALGYGSLSNVVINYRGVQQLKWLSNSPIHGAPNGRWQLQWLGSRRGRGGSESGGGGAEGARRE